MKNIKIEIYRLPSKLKCVEKRKNMMKLNQSLYGVEDS